MKTIEIELRLEEDKVKQRPRIGVAAIIINGDKILLGKRKNAHGEGTWSTPGGHLEFGESLEQCARREVLEETGLMLKNVRSGPYTNDIFVQEHKHYITIYMIADYVSGTPLVMEPEKCEQWQWFSWNALPKPLFLPLENLLMQEQDSRYPVVALQHLFQELS